MKKKRKQISKNGKIKVTKILKADYLTTIKKVVKKLNQLS